MDTPYIRRICNLRRSEESIISFIASAVSGILSGWGVGGGTLLIVFMTAVQGLYDSEARGINLLYFLPASSGALYSHIKERLINKTVFVFSASAGVIFAVLTAILSNHFSPELLKKLFGIFLLFIGIRELFKKSQ